MPSDSLLVRSLNAFARAFQRHWVAIVVGILLFYSALPFAAPVMMRYGYTNAAQFIYKPYQLVCHTYAFRSFFLFGQEVVYPRANGDGEFERASGIDVTKLDGLLAARDFQGNATMGWKVALCERDIAIYLSLAFNGMLFAALGRRARGLPWLAFVLVGMLPIGLDGFSQLFSQPPFTAVWPFSLLPFRESTWWLRLFTGSLFGASVAWLIFPLIGGAVESSDPPLPRAPR